MPGINETHPEIAAQWHPTKNGDLRPSDVTAGSNKKVWWLCPNKCPEGCAHEWEATIYSRANGSRCPYFIQNGKAKRMHAASTKNETFVACAVDKHKLVCIRK